MHRNRCFFYIISYIIFDVLIPYIYSYNNVSDKLCFLPMPFSQINFKGKCKGIKIHKTNKMTCLKKMKCIAMQGTKF